MSPFELQQNLLKRICLNNSEAELFLSLWTRYIHAIDDIEDKATTPEFRLRTFIQAAEVYSCSFYLKNIIQLKQMVYTITNMYTDSLISPDKEFNKWAAHAGIEMFLTVALIVGGYDHMRSISTELRAITYCKHHGS